MATGWYERFRWLSQAIPATGSKVGCPCCGCLTIGELGGFELCRVCFWEDDPRQFADPAFAGGANGYSLEAARENYQAIGASHPAFRDKVRRARQAELPG